MVAPNDEPFDVVASYQRLLSEDPEMTMPVAAIEALILALANTPASTVSETLDLVSKLTATLKRRIPNSISLSAGTDLFQQYLITNLQRPSSSTTPATRDPTGSSDFEHVRAHLVQNGKLFVSRAKAARATIASFGRHFIRDGTTVLTNGGSRVVAALLQSAADASLHNPSSSSSSSSTTNPDPSSSSSSSSSSSHDTVRFRVIYVVSASDPDASESSAHIAALRRRGVPVATIPPTAVAHCLDRVTQCFVGAEGVVENGGIVSRLGTYQLGLLAKAANKPFYVVSESHKFVRLYPLGQRDLGLGQKVLDFRTEKGSVEEEEEEDEGGEEGREGGKVGDEGVVADMVLEETTAGSVAGAGGRMEKEVDYTPPNLISGIITESGVLLPSAVSEELIKIWF